MNRAFLTAIYQEPKADSTFEGFQVKLKINEKREKIIRFCTGDPIYDYYAYQRWMMHNSANLSVITHSSSVDHFFMDSKKYAERHVIFNSDYTEGELTHWQKAEAMGHNIDTLPTVVTNKKLTKFSEIKKYIKNKELQEKITVNSDMTITHINKQP